MRLKKLIFFAAISIGNRVYTGASPIIKGSGAFPVITSFTSRANMCKHLSLDVRKVNMGSALRFEFSYLSFVYSTI